VLEARIAQTFTLEALASSPRVTLDLLHSALGPAEEKAGSKVSVKPITMLPTNFNLAPYPSIIALSAHKI